MAFVRLPSERRNYLGLLSQIVKELAPACRFVEWRLGCIAIQSSRICELFKSADLLLREVILKQELISCVASMASGCFIRSSTKNRASVPEFDKKE